MPRKHFYLLFLWIACLAPATHPLPAQVVSGGQIAASSAVFDFTNAGQTIPARKLASEPSTCASGELYFNTTTNTLKVCTATDTWTTYVPASGASGGILYFPSSTTTASSALLSANSIVVGGGAGFSPKATGITVDASNNVSTPGSITTGTGGVSHGKVALGEAPANGAMTVGWEAPDVLTNSLSLGFPDASPTASNVMLFPAPASGKSQFTWTAFQSSNLTDFSLLVRTNQANSYSAGDQNFSSAASLEVPVAASLTAGVNGRIGYDSTANQLHAAINSVDAIIPTRTTTAPVSGNAAKWGANGQLQDLGSPCVAVLDHQVPTAAGARACAAGVATIYSTTIKANTLSAGHCVEAFGAWNKVSGTNNYQAKLRYGSQNSLTLYGADNGNGVITAGVLLCETSGTATQATVAVYGLGSFAGGNGPVATTVDTTQDQTLSLFLSTCDNTDTFTGNGWIVKYY